MAPRLLIPAVAEADLAPSALRTWGALGAARPGDRGGRHGRRRAPRGRQLARGGGVEPRPRRPLGAQLARHDGSDGGGRVQHDPAAGLPRGAHGGGGRRRRPSPQPRPAGALRDRGARRRGGPRRRDRAARDPRHAPPRAGRRQAGGRALVLRGLPRDAADRRLAGARRALPGRSDRDRRGPLQRALGPRALVRARPAHAGRRRGTRLVRRGGADRRRGARGQPRPPDPRGGRAHRGRPIPLGRRQPARRALRPGGALGPLEARLLAARLPLGRALGPLAPRRHGGGDGGDLARQLGLDLRGGRGALC